MDITNFGDLQATGHFHHEMLPDDIRMLIVGQSGCGKTNLLVNLVLKYIKWTNLYVITTTPHQKVYDVLRELDDDDVYFISPEEIDSQLFESMPPLSFVIFDDYMMIKDQTFPQEVFSKERHKKINSAYITQKFTETDLVIRQNANILVMFNIDKKSRECVHSMFVNADMELQDFKKISLVNREFLAIIPNQLRKRRYIKNFTKYM